MDYKLSAKRNGKWWQFGSFKMGKFGYQASFKNSPELKELVNSDVQWINFSAFDAVGKPRDVPEEAKKVLGSLYDDSQDIPF